MTFERQVLIWMCILIFVNQLGFGVMVPSLRLYAETFGVSSAAIGGAIAVYGLARFVMAIPSGQVSDKWGVAESTLREKKAQGKLPTFFKLFGRVKTFECWFSIWLKEQQMEKPPAMRAFK